MKPLKVTDVTAFSAGTSAEDTAIGDRLVLIQNTHASQVMYFKEKKGDAVTTATGYKLVAGATTPYPMKLTTMTHIASGADTTGILVFLSE